MQGEGGVGVGEWVEGACVWQIVCVDAYVYLCIEVCVFVCVYGSVS